MTATDPVVFLSYARTPMGGMQGVLSDASATDLGATAVKAAVERAGVKGDDIERIYMGCVLPAGLGQAPARQAAIKAGLPKSVQATTVNKVCGSGMQNVRSEEQTSELQSLMRNSYAVFCLQKKTTTNVRTKFRPPTQQ